MMMEIGRFFYYSGDKYAPEIPREMKKRIHTSWVQVEQRLVCSCFCGDERLSLSREEERGVDVGGVVFPFFWPMIYLFFTKK